MKKPRKPRPYIEAEHEFSLETHREFSLKTLKELREHLHSYNIFYRISGKNKEERVWAMVPYNIYFHMEGGYDIYDISLTLIRGEVRNTETSFELSPKENGMLDLKFSPTGKRPTRKKLRQSIEEFFSQ